MIKEQWRCFSFLNCTKTKVFLSFFVIALTILFFVRNAPDNAVYTHSIIKIGSQNLRIPFEYILDERDRKPEPRVGKLRGKPLLPYVSFSLYEMKPLENAVNYKRIPIGNDRLVSISYSEVHSFDVFIKEFPRRWWWPSDHLVALVPLLEWDGLGDGIHLVGFLPPAKGSSRISDYYLWKKNGSIYGGVRCYRLGTVEKPSCETFLYHDVPIIIKAKFNLSDFDFFVNQGFDLIFSKFDEWVFK